MMASSVERWPRAGSTTLNAVSYLSDALPHLAYGIVTEAVIRVSEV